MLLKLSSLCICQLLRFPPFRAFTPALWFSMWSIGTPLYTHVCSPSVSFSSDIADQLVEEESAEDSFFTISSGDDALIVLSPCTQTWHHFWVLSLRHPVELLSRSKPVHSCVSTRHFGVCVWIVGSFHPSSCTSVFACCVLLNVAVSMSVCRGLASVRVCVSGLSPLALAVCVCTRWHPLTYRSIYAPHPGDTLSSRTAACLSDLLYTICRGEPCFYLSPWRPGTSPIPFSLPLSRLFVWGTWLPQNRCPVL